MEIMKNLIVIAMMPLVMVACNKDKDVKPNTVSNGKIDYTEVIRTELNMGEWSDIAGGQVIAIGSAESWKSFIHNLRYEDALHKLKIDIDYATHHLVVAIDNKRYGHENDFHILSIEDRENIVIVNTQSQIPDDFFDEYTPITQACHIVKTRHISKPLIGSHKLVGGDSLPIKFE